MLSAQSLSSSGPTHVQHKACSSILGSLIESHLHSSCASGEILGMKYCSQSSVMVGGRCAMHQAEYEFGVSSMCAWRAPSSCGLGRSMSMRRQRTSTRVDATASHKVGQGHAYTGERDLGTSL